jgi:RNA polymerase sigma-70 factor (ECF subfamily)
MTPNDESRAAKGPGEAWDGLYGELRRVASAMFRHEPHDHTWQPTALVHEAWLRLAVATQPLDIPQFRRLAVRVMRRLLVDYSRRRHALRRDHRILVPLDPDAPGKPEEVVDMLALDEALGMLGASDPRAARVAELRIFAGLTLQETAESVGLSVTHTKRVVDDAVARLRLILARH